MNKAYEKQVWKNYPDESTPLNAENLQKVSDALDTVDSRVVSLDESKADKGDIPTKLSDLSDDSTHRTVTDADKTNWNGKLTNTIDKNFYNKLQWKYNSFLLSLQNESKYSDGIDALNSYAGSVGSALTDFNDYIGRSYASLDENGCVVDSQLPNIVLHDTASEPIDIPIPRCCVVYSSEERVVGIWLDGNTLYERTISFQMPSNAGSTLYDIDFGFTYDTAFISEGFYESATQSIPFGFYNPTVSDSQYIMIIEKNLKKLNAIVGKDRSNMTAHIKIRYTKGE